MGAASGEPPDDGVEVDQEFVLGADALRDILASVEDGMLVLDDRGVVVLANPGAARLFGRPDGDLVGDEFGYPVPVGRIAEVDVLGPGGQRAVEMRAVETTIDGRVHRVVSFHDITERLRADRELRDAILMREQLLREAAHQLRTPVTVILGMAHTLHRHWEDLSEHERRDLVARLSDRGDEMVALVDSALGDDQDQWVTHPARHDVASLVRRAVDAWPELAVEIDVADDIEVHVDGGQVVEILRNLIDNSQKYGEPPIRVEARRGDGWTEIAVSDEGPGVPHDVRDAVFDPGFRSAAAKASGVPGSGLGLGIVRTLTVANGGAVRYEEGSDGSRFVVRLPSRPPTSRVRAG